MFAFEALAATMFVATIASFSVGLMVTASAPLAAAAGVLARIATRE